MGGHGSQDLDIARSQLRAQKIELFLLEIVLRRDGLEGRLVDRAPLLGLVEERLEGIKQSGQFSSRPFGVHAGATQLRGGRRTTRH
jgi:hypothetical protein